MVIIDALAGPPRILRQLRRLYKQAFPQSERKPWWLLLKLAREGKGELLAALDEQGNFCGLAICQFWQDMALLDYFAVAEKARNQRLGQRILRYLQGRYVGRRLLVEIERPGAPGFNEAICWRRRGFYHRCGLLESGLCGHVFGTELLLLWQPLGENHSAPTAADYVEIYQQLFGRQIAYLMWVEEVELWEG